jgi:Fibronectin type III domain
MHKFGGTATQLRLTSLLVLALVLGACSEKSSTGSTISSSSAGSVTLMWVPPTDNTNGTPLTDLAGYHIHYGTSPDNLTQVIELAGTSNTEFELGGLAPGTYYFSVTAYTTMGTESAESDVGYKTI